MGRQYDPDTDPATGVFYNKRGITGARELQEFEYMAATVRLRHLARHPVQGEFDLRHLCQVHGFIFQDVYPWAGRIRTVETSSRAPFAKPEYIESSLAPILASVRREGSYVGLQRDEFVSKAAWLYGEMNAVHPFREGNGRTHCHLVAELAHRAGWSMDWGKISKAELDAAAAYAMSHDASLLAGLIASATSPRGAGRSMPPALVRRPTNPPSPGM